MSIAGIAGSPSAEADGVFLAERLWEGFWFASFGQHARVDIWEVRAEGLSLQEDNEGWICQTVIPPERLRLVEADVAPDAADAWLDAQTPSWLGAEDDERSDQSFSGHEPKP
jgi:hypothetical protein